MPKFFRSVSVFLTVAILLLFPLAGTSGWERSALAQDEEPAQEEFGEKVRREFDQFLKEFQERSENKEKEWEEEEAETLQEKMDLFLADLEKKAGKADMAKHELEIWLEEQRLARQSQQEDWLDDKIFQVKVFFGGWTGFFVVLTVLFILKLVFNISLDSLYSVRDFVFGLFGVRFSRVGEHYLSPLSSAVAEDSGKSRDTRSDPPRPRTSATKKRFLFCEVWVQFVNPFADRAGIEKALEDQKEMPVPRPRVGEILRERGLMHDQEILDTLSKQRYYRSQR